MNVGVKKNDSLIHHGIEGQRWGIENGPPYPLDYEDHSAAEKRLNPKSELDNYTDSIKRFAKEHKKGLIIGGAIVTALVVSKGKKYINEKKEEKVLDAIREGMLGRDKQGERYKNAVFSAKNLNDFSQLKDFYKDFDKEFKGVSKDLVKLKYSDLRNIAKSVG